MTLHEQYKEDITNKLTQAYVKQSYLNSIDCMIANIQLNDEQFIDLGGDFFRGVSTTRKADIETLTNQRELIANEK